MCRAGHAAAQDIRGRKEGRKNASAMHAHAPSGVVCGTQTRRRRSDAGEDGYLIPQPSVLGWGYMVIQQVENKEGRSLPTQEGVKGERKTLWGLPRALSFILQLPELASAGAVEGAVEGAGERWFDDGKYRKCFHEVGAEHLVRSRRI